MSRIVHLDNGSAIKADIIETFDRAIEADENVAKGIATTNFWNFVEADMYLEHSSIYSGEYIQECFEKLADIWMGIEKRFGI